MKLYKHNRADAQLMVDYDEVIEKFYKSSYSSDARRELKVRLALFIASSEGFESAVASKKEFNELIKRYNVYTEAAGTHQSIKEFVTEKSLVKRK